MSTRLILFADIEGFGAIFNHRLSISTRTREFRDGETLALWLLHGLIDDVFVLGVEHFPNRGERLFAHLMGDGFLIAFDYGIQGLERGLALAIALMRSTLFRGGCLKIGMTQGRVADVSGCYPDRVRDARDDEGRIRMGTGIMTLTTVIGSGLIDAHKLAGDCKGPVLVYGADSDRLRSIPQVSVSMIGERFIVDWIRSSPHGLSEMLHTLGVESGEDALCQVLQQYLDQEPKPQPAWAAEARRLITGYDTN